MYRLTVRTTDNELPASQNSDTVVSIPLNVNEAPVLDAPAMFRDEDAVISNVGRVFASDQMLNSRIHLPIALAW